MLRPHDPVVLLMHGGLDSLVGKTGLAMLRYRQGPILAVVDPDQRGRTLEEVTGIRRPVPLVASIDEALPLLADATEPAVAVIGLAPSGGRLPGTLRADLIRALEAGLCLASGLHSRLGEDPELAARLRQGRWIWDLRQEPAELGVAAGLAAALPCRRVLAVGSDMAVGKMSACLELLQAAHRRGIEARFVGTGQAGILIGGGGVPLDAVRVDFAAGAVEGAVVDAAAGLGPAGMVLVEGQGSLCHPGSSATLPLLRGSQPTDLVLVHRAGQRTIRHHPEIPLPPLNALIEVSESLARLARPQDTAPPRVRAISLNTAHLGEVEALRALEDIATATGLPCHDPVRSGGEGLLEALLKPTP